MSDTNVAKAIGNMVSKDGFNLQIDSEGPSIPKENNLLFLLEKIEKMEKQIKEIVEVIAMMNNDKLLEIMQNSGTKDDH